MTLFDDIGRLPVDGDNVAIATSTLDAGLVIVFKEVTFILSHVILEGHRFAVEPIKRGEFLTSWGMSFGTASEDIEPGTYVTNEGVLEALRGRLINFELPDAPNFIDEIPAFEFDVSGFQPAEQVPVAKPVLYFKGYNRAGGRGVGTRNYIAVIGVSSRTTGFVRRVAKECNGWTSSFNNINGVVPIAHTEGDDEIQLNKTLVLRTLAGFLIHPNIGAALVVDHASASITNKDLEDYLVSEGYPIDEVPHVFMTLHGAYTDRLEEGKQLLRGWLDTINQSARTKQPLSNLKVALQCGGSDAFSGISGNPLAAWVARAVIGQGGSANLAETDELIGAESYVLKKVRSEHVARRFLHVVDRFQKRAELHGSSAAGNPTGGNKFRGLYNIYLKSLGAAMKRHPEVRLDEVIEYGERIKGPGFYFMDSPGNDLESIAGQVASGCNMIFFVTGNGSITNFPFVPTIKIVTTTGRYELLSADMDVNAGAYLDGEPMDELGRRMLHQTIKIASGKKSVGDQAGHAQVQIWRNWRLAEKNVTAGDYSVQKSVQNRAEREYSGVPVNIDIQSESQASLLPARGSTQDIGLVLPTSLCSGQISKMAVEKLNASSVGEEIGVKEFVSLVHTEGCGASSGSSEDLFLRTMYGHLLHPKVKHALLLEHGCEKTHNDFFRNYLKKNAIDTTRFGWASIQQDGGIEPVFEKILTWFEGQKHAGLSTSKTGDEQSALSVGLIITEELSPATNHALSLLAGLIVKERGSILIPSAGGADWHAELRSDLSISRSEPASLNYAQQIGRPGFHIMAAPTWHVQELLAGMGATGVQLLLVVSNEFAVQAHPFIPTLQIGDQEGVNLDWSLEEDEKGAAALVDLLLRTNVGQYQPKSRQHQNHGFQISRGWAGISL